MNNYKFHNIIVLWGGPSSEREVSYRSAKRVSIALKKRGYEVKEIEISSEIHTLLKKEKIDAVFIAIHGKLGEDGAVQGLLEIMGIPYTGSGILSSALAMNKIFSKKIWERENIPTPPYKEIGENLEEDIENGIEELGLPIVLKPVRGGSSIGVKIIERRKEVLSHAEKLKSEFGEIFLEKYVKGKEITVGILGEGENLRALPILEIVPKKGFYDYKAKYTPNFTKFIIPARLSEKVSSLTKKIALKSHISLHCSSFSRVDMIVKGNVPYVHDLNTIPGLTEMSDLPAQARAAGISYEDLIEEVISNASTGKF